MQKKILITNQSLCVVFFILNLDSLIIKVRFEVPPDLTIIILGCTPHLLLNNVGVI